MFTKITHFIKYNNAIPIFFGILFLGATGALAAIEEVREVVVASDQVIRSIDNTRIVNVDLDTYTVAILITGIEEDDTTYYIAYTLNTLAVSDGVWTDVSIEKSTEASKRRIEGRDLGTFLSEELAEARDYELGVLKRTQQLERIAGQSTKVVATVYSGLVGRFLDEKEESFPGYQLVVVPKWEPVQAPPPTTEPTPTDTTVIVGNPSDTEAPVVAVLGNNPARITLNTNYSDLGAYVTDNISNNIGYTIFVDGTEVSTVDIDTSTTTSYTITYKATDQVGNSGEATRIVEVYDPNIVIQIPEPVATTTPETATTTPVVESEPEPEPEPTPEPAVEEPTPPVEEPMVEEPVATTTPPVVEPMVEVPPVEEPVATTTPPIVEETATSTPAEG